MNLKNQFFAFITIFAVISLSFTFPDKINPITTSYSVDPSASTIIWKGKKVTGEHHGNINLLKGTIDVDGSKIFGGEFEIDMTSLTNLDLADPEYNKKLVDHLKSDDFFGTDKHATSKFILTEAISKGKDQYDVRGNLTIKGITNQISFPATISDNGNKILVKANIVVDRSKYDIRYGSGSFFDNLGDKMIYDDFELEINLVADKKLAAR